MIPKQVLPINLSCGLPNGTRFSSDFKKYQEHIPKTVDRIFGAVESGSNAYNLIIYGRTGDDIYPILFSFDNHGQVIDSLNLIINRCGGADEIQILHSFALIKKDLTIELTDTTRFIHYPERSKSVDDYTVDSLRTSKVILTIDKWPICEAVNGCKQENLNKTDV